MQTCVKCGGEFKLSLLSSAGESIGESGGDGGVLLNYVFLQPGQWGRVPGLPVLLSAANILQEMGIKAIRQGGSYASGSGGGSTEQDKMYRAFRRTSA
eukprot:COSAG05_NODE_285_length_12188_cov_539.399537_6_plen_98_part_00